MDALCAFGSSFERAGPQERPGVAEFLRDGVGQAAVVPPPGGVEAELAGPRVGAELAVCVHGHHGDQELEA